MSMLEDKHEKMLYPTVRVRTDKAGGSGTVIYSKSLPGEENKYETYVLTNCHVISDNIRVEKKWSTLLKREVKMDILSECSVEFFNFEYGSWESGQSTYKSEIMCYDKEMDLALLRLKTEKKIDYVATLFPKGQHKEKLRMFMGLYAIGCGLGHPPLATQGNLTGFNDIIDNYPYFLSSAPTIYGNCLPANNLISMADGSVRNLIDVKEGDYVLSYGEKASGLTRQAKVEKFIESGMKKIFKIKTRNRTLRASGNHPIVKINQIVDFADKIRNVPIWTQVDKLKKGDVITIMKHHIPHETTVGFNFARELGQDKNRIDFMEFLGFFIGDGYKRLRPGKGGELQLYPFDVKGGKKYEKILKELFNINVTVINNYDQLRVSSVDLVKKMSKWGFDGLARTKIIPDWVMTARPEYQMAFMRGYCEADGHINKHNGWAFEAVNKTLINQLRMLAIHIGVQVSNVSYRERTVSMPDGRMSKIKTWSFQAYPEYIKNINSYIEGDNSLLPTDLQYTKITSVEEDGEEETYDIKLDQRHTFFADGVLVHNSGGAVFLEDTCEFIGVPSRVGVTMSGFSPDAITHLSYFIPVMSIYKFIEDQIFMFIYDDKTTSKECEKNRKDKRERDEKMMAIDLSRDGDD